MGVDRLTAYSRADADWHVDRANANVVHAAALVASPANAAAADLVRDKSYAQAERARERRLAAADFAWVEASAAVGNTFGKGYASSFRQYAGDLATASRAYVVGEAGSHETLSNALVSAATTAFSAQYAVGAGLGMALAQAYGGLRAMELAQETATVQGIDDGLQSPWSQYVVDRSQARAGWWNGAQADYIENTSDLLAVGATARAMLNSALTNFSMQTNAAQRSHAESQASNAHTWVRDRLHLGENAAESASDALKTFQLDTAAAVRDNRTSRANISYELINESSPSRQEKLQADLLEADELLAAVRSASSNALNRSEAAKTGTLRVKLAEADRDFVTDAVTHDMALMGVLGSSLVDFAGSAGAATHIRNVALSQLTRDGVLGLLDSYGDAINGVAQANATPWAQRDSAEQAALRVRTLSASTSAVQRLTTTSAAARDQQNTQTAAHAQKLNLDVFNSGQRAIAEVNDGFSKAVAEAAINQTLADNAISTHRKSSEAQPPLVDRTGITPSVFDRYFTEHNAPSSGAAGHFITFLGQPFNGGTPAAEKLIAPIQAQQLPNGQVDASRPPQPKEKHTNPNAVGAWETGNLAIEIYRNHQNELGGIGNPHALAKHYLDLIQGEPSQLDALAKSQANGGGGIPSPSGSPSRGSLLNRPNNGSAGGTRQHANTNALAAEIALCGMCQRF